MGRAKASKYILLSELNLFKSIKIKIYATIAILTFSHVTFAGDYAIEAKLVFIEHRKLNNEFLATIGSVDIEVHKIKRKNLEAHSGSSYAAILATLENKFCLDPRIDVLDEFIITLLNTENSADEYPSLVFTHLFSCQPDMIESKVLSLNGEDKKTIVNELTWGFDNLTHKNKSVFPNYQILSDRLSKMTHGL